MPERIQRRRTAGWRMPEGAIYVGRPTRFGNPYVLGREGDAQRWTHWIVCDTTRPYEPMVAAYDSEGATRAAAVDLYRAWLPAELVAEAVRVLAGRDLACWCPLSSPCHADVLLEVANQ